MTTTDEARVVDEAVVEVVAEARGLVYFGAMDTRLPIVIRTLAARLSARERDLADAIAQLELPQLLCEDDDKDVCGWFNDDPRNKFPFSTCWEHRRRALLAKLRGTP